MNRHHANRLVIAILRGKYLIAEKRLPAELVKGRIRCFHRLPQGLSAGRGCAILERALVRRYIMRFRRHAVDPAATGLIGNWPKRGNSALGLVDGEPDDQTARSLCLRLWVGSLSHVRRFLLGRPFIRFGLRLFCRIGCLASFALPALEVIVCFPWRVRYSKNWAVKSIDSDASMPAYTDHSPAARLAAWVMG